jgi:hypothetical protein
LLNPNPQMIQLRSRKDISYMSCCSFGTAACENNVTWPLYLLYSNSQQIQNTRHLWSMKHTTRHVPKSKGAIYSVCYDLHSDCCLLSNGWNRQQLLVKTVLKWCLILDLCYCPPESMKQIQLPALKLCTSWTNQALRSHDRHKYIAY